MFKITVDEITSLRDGEAGDTIRRYEQTVDVLDLGALAALLNRKPRKPRTPKPKLAAA